MHSRNSSRALFLARGQEVDERSAAVLVKELGVFPPGTLLRLKNGEIAAVFRRSKDAAHPQLQCMINRDGAPLSRPAARDRRDPACGIVESVNLADYRSIHGTLVGLWVR